MPSISQQNLATVMMISSAPSGRGDFEAAEVVVARSDRTSRLDNEGIEEDPMADVAPIPDTYPRVSPHLSVAGAAEAVDFYKSVFGATERMRMATPDGTIAHAEIEIGGSVIMIGDEIPGGRDPSPKTLGGSPVALFVYVSDVDDVFERAVDAGAQAVQPPEDHFYGDRVAMFDDPFGHRWNVATHIEDVSPEQMEERMAKAMTGN